MFAGESYIEFPMLWDSQPQVTSPVASPADKIDDLIKYGEFCQLSMDGVDLNEWSRYRGKVR